MIGSSVAVLPAVREWLQGALPEVTAIPGIEFLLAIVVVVAGVWASKLLVRLLGRPVAHRFARQSVAQTILRAVRVSTIVGAFALAAWITGVEMPEFVISVAVFSAVVGVILAPLIGSVINGVFVLWDQPFEIGDMIELDDGTIGFVEDITIRYTKMFTLDNTFLVIPNSNIRDRDVTNYSAEDERTRLTLEVLVTYECDVETARTILERAARDCAGVIDGGPDIRIGAARYNASPDCRMQEFADDGVLLRLRYWAKKPYKLQKLQSQVTTRIWELIEDADVEIAYPHRHLVFDEHSGVARVGGSVEESAEESVEGTAEESVEGTAEEAVEGTAEEAVEGTAEKAVEGTAEKTVEGTAQKTVEGAAEPPDAATEPNSSPEDP